VKCCVSGVGCVLCSGRGSVRYSEFILDWSCSISFKWICPIWGQVANLLLRKVMFSLDKVRFLAEEGPLKTIERKESKLFFRVSSLNSCVIVALYCCKRSSTSEMFIGMCVCTYDNPETSCPIFSKRSGSTVDAWLGTTREGMIRNRSRLVRRFLLSPVVGLGAAGSWCCRLVRGLSPLEVPPPTWRGDLETFLHRI